MSRIITHTNIIVDDFDFCKSFPKNTFIHFLTHFHADHYEGLSPLWDYGPIYCTHQTKKFLLNKYPKLKNIYSYDYYKQNYVELVPNKIGINFYFFDAKHIPGAAMILFQGYMGTILFTGDFRYQYTMVQQNPIFFPLKLRQDHTKKQIVQKMEGISLHIDQMIFDNTYCNKAFTFQTQKYIADKMIKIISENSHRKLILIAMGALGKHKILLKIAQYFQTYIIVSQSQYQKIKVANLRTDFLSTNPEQGYIHLISKKRRGEVVQKVKKGPFGDSFICIDTDFLMLEHQSPDEINYIVPYSLHSNYQEMTTLIKMIKPSILRKLVIPYANLKQVKLKIKIDHRLKFAKYLDFLESKVEKSQSGYSNLVKHYTAVYQLSESYLKWFSKSNQKYLMDIFYLGDGSQNHNLRKRMPKLREQDDLTHRSSSNSRSLKNIADSLNAVNKNLTLEKCIQEGKKKRLQKQYETKLSQYNYAGDQVLSKEFQENEVTSAQSISLLNIKSQKTLQFQSRTNSQQFFKDYKR